MLDSGISKGAASTASSPVSSGATYSFVSYNSIGSGQPVRHNSDLEFDGNMDGEKLESACSYYVCSFFAYVPTLPARRLTSLFTSFKAVTNVWEPTPISNNFWYSLQICLYIQFINPCTLMDGVFLEEMYKIPS